ncbi:MAG: hypothetical protein QOE76_4166 [Frankiales bacterium]|nr:hypothetical protein [Frankiales bacterium]
MTRTTAAVLALGAAATLAACTSHSSAASSAGGTSATGTPSATSPAASSAPSGQPSASGVPSTLPSASTAPATTIPATVTSPGSKPSPTTSAGGDPNRCKNSQLTVSLSAADRGAGQIYSQILFVNKGTTTCTLAGHPGVSYVAGDDGHQVGASATRTGTGVTTVSLAPGATASALLHEANYSSFDQSVCKPVTVRGLRVYPPGSLAAVFLPRVGKECSAVTLPAPALSIAQVKAGSGA